MNNMNRRTFLKQAGCYLAVAGVPAIFTGCGQDQSRVQSYSFNHGVASGDPGASSVMLWTRVQNYFADSESITLILEVAVQTDFSDPVVRQRYSATSASDYTLRVLVENLYPDTVYYYRFVAPDGSVSITGRTWTAPLPDTPAEVQFAFVSCQERRHGFYGAYRELLKQDFIAQPQDKIRFILHLGDFIYETRNNALQTPIDDHYAAIADGLYDRNGAPRGIDNFPDGGISDTGVEYATTLADYRHLYQIYLSDPDLQAARAHWPFIHIWDDHEFTDDCWQTEANYRDAGTNSGTDEPSQRRKVAANQAWFEYIPVNLARPENVSADLHHSKDFEFTVVNDTPNNAPNSDNTSALDTLTIYRHLRFGTLLDLILTDNRSYRSDHAIPEGISGNRAAFLHARMALPKTLVDQLDAGRDHNGGNPETFIFVPDAVLNPRRNSLPGTLLGATQKQWWKSAMSASTATWKVWGNSVPLMRFMLNLSDLNLNLPDVIVSGDSWDGYNTERKDLMSYLRAQGINNVVSLSGDYHAHFAGLVWADYDAAEPQSVMTEFVCAAVSSISQFTGLEQLSRRDSPDETESVIRRLITYDGRATTDPADDPFVINFNNTLLNGVAAGEKAAQTNSTSEALALKHPRVNSHLKYADTAAHGYGLVRVTAGEITVELVTITGITRDFGEAGPGVLRRARFRIPQGTAAITGPEFVSGTPPFPHPA